MSTTAAVVIACIALAGSIVSAALTVFGGPALQAWREARRVLEQYREPLLEASYELQARLHGLLLGDFTEKYIAIDTDGKRQAAIDSTLYVFAQFFCWREIIRRDTHQLRFSRYKKTRRVADLLRMITAAFLSDEHDTQWMIWRVEQRGIGERMIVSIDNKVTCMGYASFLKHREEMSEWLDPLERDLRALHANGSKRRLTELQPLLLALVAELDVKPKLYDTSSKPKLDSTPPEQLEMA